MNNLLTLTNAADKAAVAETNFERLDTSMAYGRSPTLVSGLPNTMVGPPISGTYAQYQCWVDSLCSVWLCTAGGTPGTWVQIERAPVSAFPGSPPNGYRVVRIDLDYRLYEWNGSAWVSLTYIQNDTDGLFYRLGCKNVGGVAEFYLSDTGIS